MTWRAQPRKYFTAALWIGVVAIVLPMILVDEVVIRSQGAVGLHAKPSEQAAIVGAISDGMTGIVTNASGNWVRVEWRDGIGWLKNDFVAGAFFGRRPWHFLPEQAALIQHALFGISILIAVVGLVVRYFSGGSRHLRRVNHEFNCAVRNDISARNSFRRNRGVVATPEHAHDSVHFAPAVENTVLVSDRVGVDTNSLAVEPLGAGNSFKISVSAYHKGVQFERFIAKKFSAAGNFKITEWTGDKGFRDGIYVEGNARPDLEIVAKHAASEVIFAVECKYRRRLLKGAWLAWASGHAQAERYAMYQEHRQISVYVAIGLGGDPSAPNQLYIIPLNVLIAASRPVQGMKSLAVQITAVGDFESNPAGLPMFNPITQRLVFC